MIKLPEINNCSVFLTQIKFIKRCDMRISSFDRGSENEGKEDKRKINEVTAKLELK